MGCTKIAVITLGLLCSPALAESPHFEADSDEVEFKIKYQEYEAPNGIVFQSLARRIATGYRSDPERTIEKVSREMAIADDRDTRDFIKRITKEHEELSRAKTLAERVYFCGTHPGRSRSELFSDLDTLSNVEVELAAAAYETFSNSLEPDVSSRLDDWIHKTKSGFQYYVPSAKQVTEKMGIDPIAHYSDRCTKIKQKLESQQ